VTGLSIIEALTLITRRKDKESTLVKQDGAKYKIVDGIIMSIGKNPVPLVIDINDKWRVIWE